MSTNKTANYQLHLWEPGDDFLREEFNENNETLDTALKAQVEELDTAVAALSTEMDAAVSALSSEMNTAVAEAKQTAASALAAYKTSNDAAVSALSTEMNTAVANAKQTAASALAAYKASNDAAVAAATSVSGSYTGVGTEQISVTLGFRPKLLLLLARGQYGYGLAVIMDGLSMQCFYETSANRAYMSILSATVTDTGFTMPASTNCFNESDRICYYTAVR